MKYRVILEKSEEGFSVSVPGLPGCHSQGDTEEEALGNIGEAISEYLEVVADSTEKTTPITGSGTWRTTTYPKGFESG